MKKLTFLLGVMISLCQISVFAEEYPEIVLLDCEEDNGIHYRFRPISNQTMYLVDNPLKDEVNSSGKVMQINPDLNNRCILNIDLIRNQEPEDMIFVDGYTHVKMKYYAPNVRGNEMIMQFDARDTYIDTYYPEGGKWEEINFEFTWDDMEWELFQWIMNENRSWYGTDSLQNLIYIDDIVVYSTNNTSGVKQVSTGNSGKSSVKQSDNNTILTVSAPEKEEVTATLYSITGQAVSKLYKGIVAGSMEVPVRTPYPGIYLIQVTHAKGENETLKVIIK